MNSSCNSSSGSSCRVYFHMAYITCTTLSVGVKQVIENATMVAGKYYSFASDQLTWHLRAGSYLRMPYTTHSPLTIHTIHRPVYHTTLHSLSTPVLCRRHWDHLRPYYRRLIPREMWSILPRRTPAPGKKPLLCRLSGYIIYPVLCSIVL
jgi:hypothetical protein